METPLIYVQTDIPAGVTIREWQRQHPRQRTLWQRFKRWLNGR